MEHQILFLVGKNNQGIKTRRYSKIVCELMCGASAFQWIQTCKVDGSCWLLGQRCRCWLLSPWLNAEIFPYIHSCVGFSGHCDYINMFNCYLVGRYKCPKWPPASLFTSNILRKYICFFSLFFLKSFINLSLLYILISWLYLEKVKETIASKSLSKATDYF